MMQRAVVVTLGLALLAPSAAGQEKAASFVQEYAIMRPPSGDDGVLTATAFSPDGERLVAVGGHWEGAFKPGWPAQYFGNLTIWGTRDGKPLAHTTLWPPDDANAPNARKGRPKEVKSVAFSPDGATLATGDGSWQVPGEVVIWETASLKPLSRFKGHTGWVESLAFSPDGKTLATCGWKMEEGREAFRSNYHAEAKLWDLATGREVLAVDAAGRAFTSIAFSPDGSYFAVGDSNRSSGYMSAGGRINIWDARSRKKLVEYECDSVNKILFSNHAATLIAAQQEGSVLFYDVLARKPLRTVHLETRKPNRAAYSMALSPKSHVLAVGLGCWNRFGHWGELHFLDVEQMREMKARPLSFNEPITSLDFSRSGLFLAATLAKDGVHVFRIGRE